MNPIKGRDVPSISHVKVTVREWLPRALILKEIRNGWLLFGRTSTDMMWTAKLPGLNVSPFFINLNG